MKLNTCICGDSLEWMRRKRTPFADLIIADPPFNIEWKYDVYRDKLPDDVYLDWSNKWLKEAFRLLKDDGNMLVCMGDKHISDIDIMCRRELGMHRQNWMIWHYGFGQSGKLDTRRGFTTSKTHILRFVKDPNKFYFDPISVAVPSDRQLKYSDKRADPRGKCPNDVFPCKRIAGTHKERVKGISTQMPVDLLKSWVVSMCKPKGTMFDPFPGSGASLIAAKKLNRHYFGVELSPSYTASILRRLEDGIQRDI